MDAFLTKLEVKMAGRGPTSSLPSFLRGQNPAILSEQDLPIKNLLYMALLQVLTKNKNKKDKKIKTKQ